MQFSRFRLLTLVACCSLCLSVLVACGAGPRPTIPISGGGAAGTAASAKPSAAGAASSGSAGQVAGKKQYTSAPAMTIDPNKTYIATIKTNLGDIKVQLDAKNAPVTVNNFVFLAREKFYDGVIFHRVIKDFMIQGGDPTGTGTGGPGYRFNDETPKSAYEVGSIAMANSGTNTNGSQFFICEGQQCVSLPPKYNLFGKTIEGIDVVHKIAAVQTGANDKPVQPVTISTVEITEQ